MMYDGPFNMQVISTLAKSLLENSTAPEPAKMKLYRVFIELTQNLAQYSYQQVMLVNGETAGKGKVIITDEEQHFTCTTINKVRQEHCSILEKNCHDINNSSVKQLKEKKRSLRKMSDFNDTGAHIGLIMISLYSGNPLKYEILYDDTCAEYYFRITATIQKCLTMNISN